MRVTSYGKTICIYASVTQVELLIAGLRAFNNACETEKTMTPLLKDEIVTDLMVLEGAVLSLTETPEPPPEPPQVNYDEEFAYRLTDY